MSAEQDLIDAIRRITRTDPELLSSLLKEARRRGTLAAETGVGGSTEEDCCNADNQGSTRDGSDSTDLDAIPDDYDFGDQLDGIDGLTDCATGEPISLNLSGTFTPPDGWDNLTQGPVDPYYTAGKFWRARTGSYEGATPAAVAAAASAALPNETWSFSGNASGSIAYFDVTLTGGTFLPNWRIADRFTCGTSPACSVTADDTRPTEWPADGTPQIALIDGQFVGHSADPDAADYLYPSTEMYLCDGSGKQVKVVGDQLGGFMTIPWDSGAGTPLTGAAATRYRADGSRLDIIKAEDSARYELAPPTE